MAVIVNGDGILTGISSLATSLTDITSGRGTVTGVATVGTLQLGAGVSISSPRSQQAAIFTNNTEFLTVDDAGRVGVGTITPNSDAHPENEKKINVGFITAKSIAGDIDARNVVVAGISTFTGAIDVNSTSNFGGNLTVSSGNLTMSDAGNIVLGDSNGASNDRIRIGSSNDLSLFHDSNRSVINNATGELRLVCGSDIIIGKRAGDDTSYSEEIAVFEPDGAVKLYFNNGLKMKTSPSGVDVTGTLNVSGISTVTALTATSSLTVDTSGSGLPALFLTHSNSGADDWKIMAGITGVSNSGFSIYDVDSTTSRFIIDTNGNVGINNTAPVEKLGIDGNIRFINANGDTSRITALPSGSYTVGNSGGSAVAFHRVADGGGGSDEIAFETHHQGNFHGESFRIEKTGDIKVNRGDLYFGTAGKGVVLGATSNVDANTLKDYEEGTYTATMTVTSGSLSVYNNTLSYVKIGEMCHVTGRLYPQLSSTGSMGVFTFSLPFAARGSNTGQVQYEQGIVLHAFRATEDTNSNDGANRSIRNFRIVASSSEAKMIAQNNGSYGTFGTVNPHMLATFSYQTN